jgi:hypothetical protein
VEDELVVDFMISLPLKAQRQQNMPKKMPTAVERKKARTMVSFGFIVVGNNEWNQLLVSPSRSTRTPVYLCIYVSRMVRLDWHSRSAKRLLT